MESKAFIYAANFDLDEYWDSFCRYIEGRILQIVKSEEMDQNPANLIPHLAISIPAGNYHFHQTQCENLTIFIPPLFQRLMIFILGN